MSEMPLFKCVVVLDPFPRLGMEKKIIFSASAWGPAPLHPIPSRPKIHRWCSLGKTFMQENDVYISQKLIDTSVGKPK